MKKINVKSLIVMILALAMILCLAACGKPDETTAPTDTTEPAETDPVVIDPPETDPVEVDPPAVTDPVETEPVETDPTETDPKYDPIETDSPATEPVETEPKETEAPETTKKPEETLSPSAGGDHEHIYRSQILNPPSCESEGEEAMVCSYCGDAKDSTPIEALGHTPVSVEADIISFTHHTALVSACEKCGQIFHIDEYLEEHNFKSVERVADKNTDGGYIAYGYEVFACEDETCRYTLYVGSNASDGHYYVPDEGSGKMHCMFCGPEQTAPEDWEHNGNPNAGPRYYAGE